MIYIYEMINNICFCNIGFQQIIQILMSLNIYCVHYTITRQQHLIW